MWPKNSSPQEVKNAEVAPGRYAAEFDQLKINTGSDGSVVEPVKNIGFMRISGTLVMLIGILGVLGYAVNNHILKSFVPWYGSEIALPTAVALILLGIVIVQGIPLENEIGKQKRAVFLLLSIAGIAVYHIFQYFMRSGFQLFLPLIQDFPELQVAYLTSIQLLCVSVGLLVFNLYSRSWWASLGLSIVAFWLLETILFALLGYSIRLPVLFSYEQSLPTILAFSVTGVAYLKETTRFRGLLSPLLSPLKRIRLFSLLSLLSGVLILFAGGMIIRLFDNFMIQGFNKQHSDLLFVGFELVTVGLSILVLLLSLRVLFFYENSLRAEEALRYLNVQLEQRVKDRTARLEKTNVELHGEMEERKKVEMTLRQSLKRETLTKNLIQTVSRSFDVSSILQVVVRKIGIYFGVDRCLVVTYDRQGDNISKLLLTGQYCRTAEINPVQSGEIPWLAIEQLTNRVKSEQPVVVLNASSLEECPQNMQDYLKMHGVHSALGVEIKYKRISFGYLVLHQMTPRTWMKPEINFLQVLAIHVGAALYQAELFQQEKHFRQAAETLSLQKSRVLSLVSHDLKTPLAAVRRFAEILAKDADNLNETQKELVDYIAEGTEQMRVMVVDILDRARIEAGRIILNPQTVAIESLVSQLMPTIRTLAEEKDLEVQIDIQPDLVMLADPVLLRQILMNLLSNAVKYNKRHGKIWLRAYDIEDGHQRMFSGQDVGIGIPEWVHQAPVVPAAILFEIEDTGIGIPADKIPLLFTEFYRIGAGLNTVEGTGLGLAATKKLIELHGGTIDVSSVELEGSIFKVVLPKAGPGSALPTNV